MPDPGERLVHLTVRDHVRDEGFHRRGGGNPKVRDVERRSHGQRVGTELSAALDSQDQSRANVDIDELEALGVIVTLEGADSAFPMRVDSFERMSQHRKVERRPQWMLLSVHPATDDSPERAMVWIADEFRDRFLRIFEDYLSRDTRAGNPRNRELVANVARIRATVLDDLWQSSGEPPKTGVHWWEVWLRPNSEGLDALRAYAVVYDLTLRDEVMFVDQRTVCWLRATWEQLLVLPFTNVPVAELRRPQFLDTVEDLGSEERDELLNDLQDRTTYAPLTAPVVCLLDTGVRRSHTLLAGALGAHDLHSVVGPPVGDQRGHGTRMAGLALFGPLDEPLLSSSPIELRHGLESVKLLPDRGVGHEEEALGVVTAEAIAAPEVTASERPRVYCLTITKPSDIPGEASLWSASVDALCAGVGVARDADGLVLIGPPEPSAARLMIVAAGNVDLPYEQDYITKCDLEAIEDPAQAWNALTVGASTDLVAVPTDPSYAGWSAVGVAGDISPFSRTSQLFPRAGWPTKPDICMEGGNVLTDGAGDFHDGHPIVSLRTTDVASDIAIGSANATSAATAQASRLAARAMATYPSYWPETIRGLLVHSAEWTPSMDALLQSASSKQERLAMLRRFGWGIPSDLAVLSSTQSAVTLVVQDSFVPFEGDDHKARHFRLHQLPWPQEILESLGPQDVRMKVTLSYFIEPAASRRGWRRKFAYASHGLRFELKTPSETVDEFIRRVNRDAQLEEEGAPTSSGSDRWFMGARQRNVGSLHQDLWEGSGADLATSGVLAVHPVGGWWKNNSRKDRVEAPVRYALLVSLRTHEESVDLYTPIAVELAVPIEGVAITV